MSIFSLKKQVEQQDVIDLTGVRFIVLGACCKKSSDTFNNTKTAVKELGFSDEVINVGDNVVIASYGVMQSPALVLDGKVVAYGRLLSVSDVKKLIDKQGIVSYE